MTIEEKARRYDEAYKKAKDMLSYKEVRREDMEYLFPELKESEDERIRKELIDFLKEEEAKADITSKRSETLCKYIVWLEKHGGQKETLCDKCRKEQPSHSCQDITALGRCALEKQGEQKPAVEMKTPEESLGIDSDAYNKIVDECVYGEKKSTIWSEEDELHIRELERLVKQEWAIAECENDKGKIHKMSDLSFFLKTLKPQLKQEWSEEDERNASYICAALDCYYRLREDRNNTNGQEDLDKARNWLYNKLKSFRPQNTWKPNDEKMLSLIVARLHSHPNVELEEYCKEYDWLNYRFKSIRPQNTWKPSDEQMEALEHFIIHHNGSTNYAKDLEELRLQLKKIKEE